MKRFYNAKKLKRLKKATIKFHARWIVDEDEGFFICSNPECSAEFNEDILSIWRRCPWCGCEIDSNKIYKIHK